MIEYDWRFPEPDNIERLESAAKGLAELLTTVQESLGLLLAGVQAKHGEKVCEEMARRLGIDESTCQTLNGAYQKLREEVNEMHGPGYVVPLTLPQGDFADDFCWWFDAYDGRITLAMFAGVLNPAEIEELLPILHERLAESELRETIDQKVRCFFCGNGFNHLSDPCLICADHLKSGCILVGVQDGKTAKASDSRKHMPRRTGNCFRVSHEFIREHWPDDANAIICKRWAYIDESDARRLGLEP